MEKELSKILDDAFNVGLARKKIGLRIINKIVQQELKKNGSEEQWYVEIFEIVNKHPNVCRFFSHSEFCTVEKENGNIVSLKLWFKKNTAEGGFSLLKGSDNQENSVSIKAKKFHNAKYHNKRSFDEQLEESKNIVKEFINNIFGEGKTDDYKRRNIYDYFYNFNFDWLNYEEKEFDKMTGKYIEKDKSWCVQMNYVRPQLDNIEENFEQLTGLERRKLTKISNLCNKKFRNAKDPDSMKIIFHILFVIYSDIIKSSLPHEINKDITDLFKGDTMHSMHYSFGNPKYEGKEVKNSENEYIFMNGYIDGFSKIDSQDEEILRKVKEFFNQYHTLGNFVLTPAITVNGQSINKYRGGYDRDNYYAYIDELFKVCRNSKSILDLLIEANKGFFMQFKDKNEYCESLDISYEDGKNYTKLRKEALDNKDNSEYMKKYIEVVEKIINERCGVMIETLYEKLTERKGKSVKMFDCESFINDVKIERECKGDDCEYEVTKKAMGIYLKYPSYGDWEILLHGNTLQDYLRNGEHIKDGHRGVRYYRGAYLLKNKEKKRTLTADILTSIGKPFKAIVLNGNADTGEGIKKYLCNDVNEKYLEERKEIIKYLKAFAYVYYWCGNMMPVVCNWKGATDEGIHKARVLYEAFDASETDVSETRAYLKKWMSGDPDITGRNVKVKDLYTGWINTLWKGQGRKKFFENYYLNDFIKKDKDQKILVREDIPLFDYKSLSNSDIINWLLINTKLIIQRSYRIQCKFFCDWNCKKEHMENVKSIMRYVFKQVGFDEKCKFRLI